MTCEHCGGEITYAPVLVPRFPRGAFRYCNRRVCTAAAARRAAVAFPRLSGVRRRKPREVSPA